MKLFVFVPVHARVIKQLSILWTPSCCMSKSSDVNTWGVLTYYSSFPVTKNNQQRHNRTADGRNPILWLFMSRSTEDKLLQILGRCFGRTASRLKKRHEVLSNDFTVSDWTAVQLLYIYFRNSMQFVLLWCESPINPVLLVSKFNSFFFRKLCKRHILDRLSNHCSYKHLQLVRWIDPPWSWEGCLFYVTVYLTPTCALLANALASGVRGTGFEFPWSFRIELTQLHEAKMSRCVKATLAVSAGTKMARLRLVHHVPPRLYRPPAGTN